MCYSVCILLFWDAAYTSGFRGSFIKSMKSIYRDRKMVGYLEDLYIRIWICIAGREKLIGYGIYGGRIRSFTFLYLGAMWLGSRLRHHYALAMERYWLRES